MAQVTTPYNRIERTHSAQSRSALVLGGGLAGIAAAIQLAESGWEVTLLEARATLGGRAFSFSDPRSGLTLDNGQHVIVGACRNLLALLEKIGARDLWSLQSRLDVAVYDDSGRLGRLFGVSAPSPLSLLPAFVTYPHLSWPDKLAAVRGLLSMMLTQRSNPSLEEITFYDWLRAHHQTDRAVSNLWNVLIEGTLNDNVRDVSASMGLMIVQDGLLAGRNTANIGYPTAPLSEALGLPAQRYLEGLGVRVVTGCPVRSINANRDRVVDHVAAGNGMVMEADAFVSAVPFWVLPGLVGESLASAEFYRQLSQLETSPIVNVHLLYDRQVMVGDFCYFIESPLQWVFNSTRIFGADHPGDHQSLSVSISAAWDRVDSGRDQIADVIAAEMTQAFPAAREATLLDCVVVKQRNATFRCVPGANRFRPDPGTDSPNLFLAGEWTNTGWPSTMESAVISGYNAAQAVMSAAGARVHAENDRA